MTYQLALHIFRRDLRLHDNTALRYALAHAREVLPCFIFDPRQVKENPYKSYPAITFMVESLQDLDEQLHKQRGKLYLFYGTAEEVIERLTSELPIDLVTFNRDYTPFAQKRDHALRKALTQRQIDCHVAADALLHEPEAIQKQDGTPYTIFTPFFKRATTFPIPAPFANTATNYWTKPLQWDQGNLLLERMLPPKKDDLLLKGGTQEGRKLLQKAQALTSYAHDRDYPALGKTSYLSAHHKFGTLSIRETFHTLRQARQPALESLIRQLYWRDFFTHIAYHFPHVFGAPFYKQFSSLEWTNDPEHFQKWCAGSTGFPIVDAGMRELNTTGYMHNRLRMITASFLVKDLHIDWRWGEKYFAQKLIDYDPSVNNGSWQWAASTGCDAQPYFRIFNPWRQQVRFDPECLYIKKWIPELHPFLPQQMHHIPSQPLLTTSYPAPIVDHKQAADHAKMLYQVKN